MSTKAIALCSLAGMAMTPCHIALAQTSTELAEIIVTARKRQETAQDVPVAVTAISAEQITARDVTSVEKLTGGPDARGEIAEATQALKVAVVDDTGIVRALLGVFAEKFFDLRFL